MNCPGCGEPGSRVYETRCFDGKVVHRKRRCLYCLARWRTIEKMVPGTMKGPDGFVPSAAKRGPVKPAMRFAILSRDGFRCFYCGATGDSVKLEVDHVNPRCKGGETNPDNLVTACHACNSGKGTNNL